MSFCKTIQHKNPLLPVFSVPVDWTQWPLPHDHVVSRLLRNGGAEGRCGGIGTSPLMPASAVFPWIPSNAQESLRDPVSVLLENLEYVLGQLPNRRGAESADIPYELWRRAVKAVKGSRRKCIQANEVPIQKACRLLSWLWGLVLFLYKFKKGEHLAIPFLCL